MQSTEKIIQVFYQLLNEKDYAQIHINEISKKAHITRTYFYQLFDDKEDLAKAALVDINDPFFRHFANSFKYGISHEAYLHQISLGLTYVQKKRSLFLKLFKAVGSDVHLKDFFKKRLLSSMYHKLNIIPERQNQFDYFIEIFCSATLTTIKWIILHPQNSTEEETLWLDEFTWTALKSLLKQ